MDSAPTFANLEPPATAAHNSRARAKVPHPGRTQGDHEATPVAVTQLSVTAASMLIQVPISAGNCQDQLQTPAPVGTYRHLSGASGTKKAFSSFLRS